MSESSVSSQELAVRLETLFRTLQVPEKIPDPTSKGIESKQVFKHLDLNNIYPGALHDSAVLLSSLLAEYSSRPSDAIGVRMPEVVREAVENLIEALDAIERAQRTTANFIRNFEPLMSWFNQQTHDGLPEVRARFSRSPRETSLMESLFAHSSWAFEGKDIAKGKTLNSCPFDCPKPTKELASTVLSTVPDIRNTADHRGLTSGAMLVPQFQTILGSLALITLQDTHQNFLRNRLSSNGIRPFIIRYYLQDLKNRFAPSLPKFLEPIFTSFEYLSRKVSVQEENGTLVAPLEEIMEKHPRGVLVAPGGGGKTWQFQNLLVELAKTGQSLPIYIPLRNFKPTIPGHNLKALLHTALDIAPDAPLPDLTRLNTIFLLDGYDEISRTDYEAFAYQLNNLLAEVPLAACWISSRYNPGLKMATDSVKEASFLPVTLAEAMTFIERLFGRMAHGEALVDAESFSTRVLSARFIEVMANNPFLLTLYVANWRECGEGAIENPAEVLQALMEKYLKREREKRPEKATIIEESVEILRTVAYHLLSQGTVSISRDELLEIIRQKLDAGHCESLRHLPDRIADLIEPGFLVENDDYFSFWHLSFMDYFAAEYLAKIENPDELTRQLIRLEDTIFQVDWFMRARESNLFEEDWRPGQRNPWGPVFERHFDFLTMVGHLQKPLCREYLWKILIKELMAQPLIDSFNNPNLAPQGLRERANAYHTTNLHYLLQGQTLARLAYRLDLENNSVVHRDQLVALLDKLLGEGIALEVPVCMLSTYPSDELFDEILGRLRQPIIPVRRSIEAGFSQDKVLLPPVKECLCENYAPGLFYKHFDEWLFYHLQQISPSRASAFFLEYAPLLPLEESKNDSESEYYGFSAYYRVPIAQVWSEEKGAFLEVKPDASGLIDYGYECDEQRGQQAAIFASALVKSPECWERWFEILGSSPSRFAHDVNDFAIRLFTPLVHYESLAYNPNDSDRIFYWYSLTDPLRHIPYPDPQGLPQFLGKTLELYRQLGWKTPWLGKLRAKWAEGQVNLTLKEKGTAIKVSDLVATAISANEDPAWEHCVERLLESLPEKRFPQNALVVLDTWKMDLKNAVDSALKTSQQVRISRLSFLAKIVGARVFKLANFILEDPQDVSELRSNYQNYRAFGLAKGGYDSIRSRLHPDPFGIFNILSGSLIWRECVIPSEYSRESLDAWASVAVLSDFLGAVPLFWDSLSTDADTFVRTYLSRFFRIGPSELEIPRKGMRIAFQTDEPIPQPDEDEGPLRIYLYPQQAFVLQNLSPKGMRGLEFLLTHISEPMRLLLSLVCLRMHLPLQLTAEPGKGKHIFEGLGKVLGSDSFHVLQYGLRSLDGTLVGLDTGCLRSESEEFQELLGNENPIITACADIWLNSSLGFQEKLETLAQL